METVSRYESDSIDRNEASTMDTSARSSMYDSTSSVDPSISRKRARFGPL
jgi:hypothetical protein